ncbi:hypothetical protein ACFLTY_03510 [Chloroflexota bacterium]
MEVIKNLIALIRRSGLLFIAGIILVVYILFGFIYLQQISQQQELSAQIAKLGAIIARGLPSGEALQTEYEEVKQKLAPMKDSEAIRLLVDTANKSGIDVNLGSDKFRVPQATFRSVRMAGGTYKVLSFNGIRAQGDYDDVMALISDLDSGKTLETMVLTNVSTTEVDTTATGEDAVRRAEFSSVTSAVSAMMNDNNLFLIPNPISFDEGVAVNLMGDDPSTTDMVEGFPDITTKAASRGYTGNDTPRDGYVLYKHDKISTANTSHFETVSYINKLTTNYYYTCEAYGKVRQFDKAEVAAAREYLGREETKVETIATINVDIYTKP